MIELKRNSSNLHKILIKKNDRKKEMIIILYICLLHNFSLPIV